jgi:hypothetical protein
MRRSSPSGQAQNANFDHAKYNAIGERDRTTSRFVEPAIAAKIGASSR